MNVAVLKIDLRKSNKTISIVNSGFLAHLFGGRIEPDKKLFAAKQQAGIIAKFLCI